MKPAERFGKIIKDHFAIVSPEEFKERLYDASHGEFGKRKTKKDSKKSKRKNKSRQ